MLGLVSRNCPSLVRKSSILERKKKRVLSVIGDSLMAVASQPSYRLLSYASKTAMLFKGHLNFFIRTPESAFPVIISGRSGV